MYAQRRLIIEAIIAAGLGEGQIWTCPGPDDYPVLLSRRALTKVFIGVIIPSRVLTEVVAYFADRLGKR